MRHLSFRLALQATLSCASTINEKGPCRAFPYQSTQDSRMPIDGSRTQIWTCGGHLDPFTRLFALVCPGFSLFCNRLARGDVSGHLPCGSLIGVDSLPYRLVSCLGTAAAHRPPPTSFKKLYPIDLVEATGCALPSPGDPAGRFAPWREAPTCANLARPGGAASKPHRSKYKK